MANRFWETLTKDKEKSTPPPWWLKVLFGIGFLIGIGGVVFFAGLFFLFVGWIFAALWNYAITPIFNLAEITSYMGAALLGLFYGTIRLLKFAFKN